MRKSWFKNTRKTSMIALGNECCFSFYYNKTKMIHCKSKILEEQMISIYSTGPWIVRELRTKALFSLPYLYYWSSLHHVLWCSPWSPMFSILQDHFHSNYISTHILYQIYISIVYSPAKKTRLFMHFNCIFH